MSIGVNVTDEDLQAIRILYKVRWSAEISNWKERDTDYCLWKVACPDTTGHILVQYLVHLYNVHTYCINLRPQKQCS